MLKLKMMNEFDKAIYHGFTLQKGFWYGVDTETGKYIAASGWESDGNTAVYFKEGNSWIMRWIDVDSEFYLENIPRIDIGGKMSFTDWLEVIKGITPEEFDEFYNWDEEYKEYNNSYLYDGLPQFVINYIERPGRENKIDISTYADPKYDVYQIRQIRQDLMGI